MGELLTPAHLMVVAAVALVLFGGKKLPELGKGLGEGFRAFRNGIKGLTDELGGSKIAIRASGTDQAVKNFMEKE